MVKKENKRTRGQAQQCGDCSGRGKGGKLLWTKYNKITVNNESKNTKFTHVG